MWQFLTAVSVAMINRFSERAFFGLLIVGAFVLAMGTLAYNPLPGDETGKTAELFGQGLVALIGAIGIIVGAIWKMSPTEKVDRDTINKLVDKTPPAPEAKETIDDRSSHAPAEGAPCPVCGAYRLGLGVDQPGTYAAPDNIPGVQP